MKKKIIKTVMICAASAFMLASVFSLPAFAQISSDNLGLSYGNNIGLSNKDPRDIAVNIIQVLLGFLAIIVVIIILLGGFKWMTAGGNEDKVAEAKKLISAGIVGLIVILASWGIASFVVGTIYNATL